MAKAWRGASAKITVAREARAKRAGDAQVECGCEPVSGADLRCASEENVSCEVLLSAVPEEMALQLAKRANEAMEPPAIVIERPLLAVVADREAAHTHPPNLPLDHIQSEETHFLMSRTRPEASTPNITLRF